MNNAITAWLRLARPRTGRIAVIGTLLLFAGCKSVSTAPRDLLDAKTGNTVTVAEKPLLFVRVRGQGPALVRDYVRLVGAETFTLGQFSDFLVLYRWSVSSSGDSTVNVTGGSVLISADEQVIELKPLEQIPAELAQCDVLFKPDSVGLVIYAYRADPEQLRSMATSKNLQLQLPGESLAGPFLLWRDGRPALLQLIDPTGAH